MKKYEKTTNVGDEVLADVTTVVKIVVKERTFNQMWKDADKRLKSSINRFYENFIKNK